MFSLIFPLNFFYSRSRRWRYPTLESITTAQDADAEEEKDEEEKKKMDPTEKVTLELTARLIIASYGLRRACMWTWSKTSWVDGKPWRLFG